MVTSALPVRMSHYNCLPSHQPRWTCFPLFFVASCPTVQCWSLDWFPTFDPVRSWSACSIPVPVLVFCLTLVWSLSDSHPHWFLFLRTVFLWYWKLPLNLNSGLCVTVWVWTGSESRQEHINEKFQNRCYLTNTKRQSSWTVGKQQFKLLVRTESSSMEPTQGSARVLLVSEVQPDGAKTSNGQGKAPKIRDQKSPKYSKYNTNVTKNIKMSHSLLEYSSMLSIWLPLFTVGSHN